MITYDEFEDTNYSEISGWTDRVKFLLYECDCVCMNYRWVIARLNNNEYVEIYQKFISYAREYLRTHKDLEQEKIDLINQWLIDAQKELYRICSNIIQEYCLPR